MTTMIRKIALGAATAAAVMTPAISSMPSASAATPYYLTGGVGYNQNMCNINKAAAERQANSGGNHIVWIGQTGCKRMSNGMWTTGEILYSATHMTTRYDTFVGWDQGSAMSKARSAQNRI